MLSILILGGITINESFAGKDDLPQGKPFQLLEDEVENLQEQIDLFDLAALFEIFIQKSEHADDIGELQGEIDELSDRLSFLENVLDTVNVPPQVDAGNNQHILNNPVSLSGSASDDGLATSLTFTWSKLSGTGVATFSDPSSLNTDVSFSEYGSYVLELSAFDGLQTSTDTIRVNYDQNMDFVASSSIGTNNIAVNFNNGFGYFGIPVDYDAGDRTRSVATGDFDNDFDVDIVESKSNGVIILLNEGENTFSEPLPIEIPEKSPTSVEVGDFNQDGNLDILTVNADSRDITVLLGNGDNTFEILPSHYVGTSYTAVTVDDLNSDEILDLVYASYSNRRLSVLHGNGDGTFTVSANISVPYSSPSSVTTGDFTGDGIKDLATANYNGHSIIFRGTGNGQYTFFDVEYSGTGLTDIDSVDYDSDGDLDIVISNYRTNSLWFFNNDGAGHFDYNYYRAVGLGPRDIEIQDLNGNGIPDIVVSNYRGHSMSVLHGDGSFFSYQRAYLMSDYPWEIAIGSYN